MKGYENRTMRVIVRENNYMYKNGPGKPSATVILENGKNEYAPRLSCKFEPVMESGVKTLEMTVTIPEQETFIDEDTGKRRPIFPQWRTDGYDPAEHSDGGIARGLAEYYGIGDFLGECVNVRCSKKLKTGEVVVKWLTVEED